MARRLVAVAAVLVSALLWAGGSSPATAAVSEPSRTCRPGAHGNVCITVRTDYTNVRARVGMDAPEYLNADICLEHVRLYLTPWEGGGGTYLAASRGEAPCVKGNHQSFYTPTVRLQFGTYCGFATYGVYVKSVIGQRYSIKTCWVYTPV